MRKDFLGKQGMLPSITEVSYVFEISRGTVEKSCRFPLVIFILFIFFIRITQRNDLTVLILRTLMRY